MGLGLPICKSIIEAHQGTLTVASREPHGAVFRIEFRVIDRRQISNLAELPRLESGFSFFPINRRR